MARTVRDARLETREARKRLAVSHEPYWRTVTEGRHIGYRKGTRGGVWRARMWIPGQGYVKCALGTADDTEDADGKTVLSYRQALDAARAWFEARLGPSPAAGPYTVKAAVADYVAFLKAERRTGTDAEKRLAKHVLPAIGEKVIAELVKADIEGVKRGMVRTDPDDPDAERRSKDTANRVLSSLKAALNMAWRDPDKGIPSDAAWRTVRPFHDVGRARQVHLDPAQSRRLLNSCQGRLRDLVTAGLVTGARLGELTGMRVGDFHGELRTLYVRDGKTGPRDVILTPEGVRFFESITAGRHPDDLLLPRDDGTPWEKQHVIRAMREAVKRAKLPAGTTFYTLRHTCASQSLLGGMNMQLLAENLGTSVRMIEQNYGKFLAASRRKLIEESGFKLGLSQPSNVRQHRPEKGDTSPILGLSQPSNVRQHRSKKERAA